MYSLAPYTKQTQNVLTCLLSVPCSSEHTDLLHWSIRLENLQLPNIQEVQTLLGTGLATTIFGLKTKPNQNVEPCIGRREMVVLAAVPSGKVNG